MICDSITITPKESSSKPHRSIILSLGEAGMSNGSGWVGPWKSMQSDLESEGLMAGRGCISKMSDGRRLQLCLLPWKGCSSPNSVQVISEGNEVYSSTVWQPLPIISATVC